MTDYFGEWLGSIKDPTAKRRIRGRVRRAEGGNFGDCATVGEGISEMRLHFSPSYRIYFTQTGMDEYTLLTGGGKDTQTDDIGRAKEAKREIERSANGDSQQV